MKPSHPLSHCWPRKLASLSNPYFWPALITGQQGRGWGGRFPAPFSRIRSLSRPSGNQHSRAFLLRAYLLQTHEMLFDAHWHGFRVFGGVPARGIYDNMRTAVDRVGRGKERHVNIRFLAMTNHYVFEPEFCNPASGWEKGQVEKNVRDARHQMLQGMPDFPDLAALNAWLEQRCQDLWRETARGTLPGTIADAWAEELR